MRNWQLFTSNDCIIRCREVECLGTWRNCPDEENRCKTSRLEGKRLFDWEIMRNFLRILPTRHWSSPIFQSGRHFPFLYKLFMRKYGITVKCDSQINHPHVQDTKYIVTWIFVARYRCSAELFLEQNPYCPEVQQVDPDSTKRSESRDRSTLSRSAKTW